MPPEGLDMSNPAIREYISLTRLQVLTPLSLLINIASVAVCTFVSTPSLGGIVKLYPTSITPARSVISIYVLAVYVGQVGYCLLLVIARKAETKSALIKGVGFTLVAANWVMAFWAIAWILQYFIIATILQGILVLVLIFSNINLLVYHTPTASRPLDMALIHAPMRFFLILPLSLTFAYNLFIALGMTYEQTPSGIPINYSANPWPGFGVVLGTNLISLAVIIFHRDIVWCVAATWVCISVWSARPKAAPIYITVLVFTLVHPLALFAAYIYREFYANRRIALPPDEYPPNSVNGSNPPRAAPPPAQGPRELDAEALWG